MIIRKEIDIRFQKLNRMIGWRETERAIFETLIVRTNNGTA